MKMNYEYVEEQRIRLAIIQIAIEKGLIAPKEITLPVQAAMQSILKAFPANSNVALASDFDMAMPELKRGTIHMRIYMAKQYGLIEGLASGVQKLTPAGEFARSCLV